MKNLKITLSTIVATLFLCVSINMLNAEEVEARRSSGYITDYQPCPDRLEWVIRCGYGPGYCNPGDQYFCDEFPRQN